MSVARINIKIDDKLLDPGVLALMTRLEVRESDTDPSVAAIRFRLAQGSGGEFSPIDDALFAPYARLSLEIEAPGANIARIFEGYLTHVRPHFETIESNCYVELLATDAAVLLDAEERVQSYPDMTDAEAAEEVFGRYNMDHSVEPTSARHEADKRLLLQRSSDWDFLRRLARRNGFVCYFEPDPATGKVTAYFKPRAMEDTPQADLTILRENENLVWIDFQFVMKGPTQVRGAAIDPIDKRLVRGVGEPVLPKLGESSIDDEIEAGLGGAGGGEALALLRDTPPLEGAASSAASAASDRALFAVEARGELDPALYRGLLRARRPALVKGVGRAFAGVYYVRAVRTTFEEGVLRQTFVAERNAMGLSGKEDFGKSAEEIGPQ